MPRDNHNKVTTMKLRRPEPVAYLDSPIGPIEVSGTAGAVKSVRFVNTQHPSTAAAGTMVARAARQLKEYFSGQRRVFELQLDFSGTDFQRAVWKRLLDIPFGRTTSYQDIAVAVGRPQAMRAVGAANGANPIAIIAPCHRVIGKSGHLTGYGSGVWRKEWLLRHEGLPFASTDRIARSS
jgi:methylated-DNA-[protein]-cysteine S-methyltransferase